MKKIKRILVTPLNWGLGHATRCMPIIDQMLKMGHEVILASDGRSLALLNAEYPNLKCFRLPAYDIRYDGRGMIWTIGRQLPKISKAVFLERKAVSQIVNAEKIDVIISDNRYGCRNRRTKNIFITHQINISIPNRVLEIVTNKINHQFIRRFDECWVPDIAGPDSLAGKLSESELDIQYIGPLSRFQKYNCPIEYDLIAVLSGPEPQRTKLEEIIIEQVLQSSLRVLIVQGKTEAIEDRQLSKSVRMVSFMKAKALNEAILKSRLVLARSGYSTIMDLAVLGKQAILVPTPGQTEQEYLSDRLMKAGFFYSQNQNELNLEKAMEFSPSYQFPEGSLQHIDGYLQHI